MWPTPRAKTFINKAERITPQGRLSKDGKQRFGLNLDDAVRLEEMKMWRTPTTMDSKEDSLKHATKLVQGKNLRSTGSRIQISLADEVMVQEIMNNPELMEKYKDYEMVTRKNLPEQQEFVDYMREQTSVKELHEKTGITKTTVEHWFRRDKAGFSHPSIEDWNLIKPHLKTIKYDKEMTTLHSIEWKEEMRMWRTPDAHCDRGASSEKRMKMKLEKKMPISINDQVAHPNLMWPTPTVCNDSFYEDKSPNKDKRHSRGLASEVTHREKLWPTPTQDSATERTKKYKQGGTPLTLAVRKWPTPTARDWKDSGKAVVNSTRHLLPQAVAKSDKKEWVMGGGALNPMWVEWLMGYEAGYTDLKDWEMLSSRKSRKK